MAKLTDINGIGPALAKRLAAAGISTVGAVATANPTTLAQVQGLSEATAAGVIADAKKAANASKAPPRKKPAGPSKKNIPTKTDAGLARKVAKLDERVKRLEKQLAKAKKSKGKKKKKK